jgi:hypothetical protein
VGLPSTPSEAVSRHDAARARAYGRRAIDASAPLSAGCGRRPANTLRAHLPIDLASPRGTLPAAARLRPAAEWRSQGALIFARQPSTR